MSTSAANSSVTVCPFCNSTVSISEIDSHSNKHFEDEEQVAMDMELAHQLALSPPSSSSSLISSVKQRNGDRNSSESERFRNGGMSGNGILHNNESINSLISVQIKSKFYKVQDGLITLLRQCLELENENSTSILSGYVDHYHSTESEDSGWGCGWRNIQMLSSHLLMQRQEARTTLFGGTGFVPDIASLQRWLEIGWESGFDTAGSKQFNNKIYGSTKWIGSTECAALLRSFGIRVRIVDFGPKEAESLFISQGINPCKRGKRKGVQVHGPMDRFLTRKQQNISRTSFSGDENSSSSSRGHQALVDWVWNYFSDDMPIKPSNHVIVTDKAPLYFQHDGHSRTIVGIQAKLPRNGLPQYNLLILDPGHRTEALESSLKENVGWQKLIKRGVRTLKKPQYQLCYVDIGIAHGEEMDQLKTIDSVFFEI